MTKKALKGIRAVGLMACVLVVPFSSRVAVAQDSTTTQLLGKAHALEVRGRMDMAKQTWAQVLLVDPNNAEALAGMARAAKSEGKIQEANSYLGKLRSLNPSDPNIAKVENMGTAQDQNVLLQQAGRLSQQGQYARAMVILKQVYGNNPPPGDAALSYYQTEAATEDTRPQAIAGLRAMADKYPEDGRYEIALGKILTYNPRTRAEGRKLLAKHQGDADASEALRQALTWDQANPSTAGEIKSYLAKHPDQGLQNALIADEKKAPVVHRAPALTPEQKAAQAEKAAEGREVQQAYAALNAKRYSEAEQRFQAMLAKNPNDPKALAGLGYIRMQQANFAGAISFLGQAEQNGDHTAGLQKALSDARFYYTMRSATGALTEDDLNTAIQQFETALQMRPNDATALQGLGGTLLKAEQPEPAISVYTTYVKLHANDWEAWKGLFLAYAGANQFDMAIGVDRRIPASQHAQLMRDPDYLRTLASVYSATNRDAEAQRTLAQALQLPFPANARGLRADVQMQYAALLEAAGHHEQAAGLYREVLAADSNNTNAWVGLIQTEHSTGQDFDAFQQLSQMPPTNYQAAMQEPGFATTVASIYMSQGHDDLAQNVLEQFLQTQQANGQKPFVAAQVTLANLYLKHNDTNHAFPLFENILTNNPDRPDAWKGLLNSLHATGHNQEALAEIQQMSPDMRRQLEADPDYLQTVAGIYADLGHPADAMRFLQRANQHFQAQGVRPPSNNDIQTAWLLFNSNNDPALYKQLMMLGGRDDLTDEQRRTVQTIWASWAVRRSQQALAAHNPKRAIAILNAAAQSFPNNPGVLKALGSGYAAAGLPKEAIQIFKAQDLSSGTAADYRSAVGAALSANDLKDAEVWLRFGLAQYPRDAQLLGLAAKFETARGNAGRAADYYRASLNAMPGPDPGAELAEEMSHAPLVRRLPRAEQSQDLATLLAQPDAPLNADGTAAYAEVPARPYLPSFGTTGVQAPVILNQQRPTATQQPIAPGYRPSTATPRSTSRSGNYVVNPNYPTSSASGSEYTYPSTTTIIQPDQGTVDPAVSYSPQQMEANPNATGYTSPSSRRSSRSRTKSSGTTTLGNYQYVPQSEVIAKPLPGRVAEKQDQAVLHLTQSPESVAKNGPYLSFLPGEAVPSEKGSEALTAEVMFPHASGSMRVQGDIPQVSFLPVNHADARALLTVVFQEPVPAANPFAALLEQPKAKATKKKPAPHVVHAKKPTQSHIVPARPAEQSAASTPRYVPPPIYIPGVAETPATGVVPERTITIAAPVSQQSFPVSRPATTSASTRKNAAARAAAIRANQANAPVVLEGVAHPPVENYDTETNGAEMHPAQFSPSAAQGDQVPRPQPSSLKSRNSSLPATQPTGDPYAVTPAFTNVQTQDATPGQQYPQPNTRKSTTTTRRRSTAPRTTTHTAPLPAPVLEPQGTMNYPVYPQPLQNEGTPGIPAPYPMPQAPTDRDLRMNGVPPLRGYFDPRISNDPKEPLTEREQTQLDLASIEASYSHWMGGTVVGRYRSGRPGVDRLESLETPFEASFVLGKWARFSVIPKAVFLNSGQLVLDPNATASPLIGSLYATAASAPVQQFASGVGGEAQLTTSTFSVAVGSTPFGFPVQNMIGRARWRPGNWHFTLYGGRDAVTETMLSYAGLRDPGSAFGNIWGGVVSTGGGVRFDPGDAKSGLYVQAEGFDVSGYHVLENRKYDGTMGAYFRVATWEDYGSLNVGGTLFGEHFDYNERGQTYGLGGYFSPNAYFLAAVPITFDGHWKEDLHYRISGSVGIQTFQEDRQNYFPLDSASQSGVPGCNVNTGVGCGLTLNSNTGANYSVDSALSYHINDHWYIGGFLTANNTNNYNTVSGGIFARYTFHPQVQTVEYPTGLFPVEGFRPIRVP